MVGSATARATQCDDEYEEFRELDFTSIEGLSAEADAELEALKWEETATLSREIPGVKLRGYSESISFVPE